MSSKNDKRTILIYCNKFPVKTTFLFLLIMVNMFCTPPSFNVVLSIIFENKTRNGSLNFCFCHLTLTCVYIHVANTTLIVYRGGIRERGLAVYIRNAEVSRMFRYNGLFFLLLLFGKVTDDKCTGLNAPKNICNTMNLLENFKKEHRLRFQEI